jgi:acetyl esterase/lipase
MMHRSSMLSILELPPPPADVRIPYGHHREQFGELRMPAGGGPHPAAVVLHGGFWRAEHDLAHLGHLCAALTAIGIATWNLEYRRIGHAAWPAAIDDVLLGIGALPDVAGLDLRRIALVGFSAGGQLAIRAASDIIALRGVVSLAGLLDLRAAHALGLGGGAVDALLGAPDAHPERYADASPIERRSLPTRQVIVHGAADTTVPPSISAAYCAAARARGDAIDERVLAGAGHIDLIDPRAACWPAVVGAIQAALA